MSYTQPKTPQQLKDYILERLGAPIINIEVTPGQIYQCIQRALELYGEYHFNGLNRTFIAVHVGTSEQAKNGVFDLSDQNVFAITDVVRGGSSNLLTMDGTATYPWVSDFILGMTGFGGSGGCQRSFGPNAYGADLGYFTTIMQYWNMIKDMFNPVPDYWFNHDTGQLKLIGQFKQDDIIIMECWVKSFVDTEESVRPYVGYATLGQNSNDWSVSDMYNNADRSVTDHRIGNKDGHAQGAFNNRWVKDYATALVKEVNGNVLAKHQGLQLPGGTTIDGVRLIEEARIEKERLIQELDLLSPPLGIYVG